MNLRSIKNSQLTPRLFLSCVLSFSALSVVIPTQTVRAQTPSKRPAQYQGTGSCSSSNCHGAIRHRSSTSVLQNEYTTWSSYDKHSKAYTNLTTDDAQKMAQHLGIKDATKEPLCLKCHTTYVPDGNLHGTKYSIEDCVSCESCHGASEHWLTSHSERTATHEQNLAHGLQDTYSLPERAQLCLSCHYGEAEQQVTHRLYGAGHPRLTFELDTYSILQPKHWVIDTDYKNRKSDYLPVRTWLMGQAQHSLLLVSQLQNPSFIRNGALPELSIFDCYSCHHPLKAEQWKERTYSKEPGSLKLNLAPLLLLHAGISKILAPEAQELEKLIRTIHPSFQKNGALPELEKIQALLEERLIPGLTNLSYSETVSDTVFHSIVSFGLDTPFPTFEVAEQIGMGLQAVLATSPTLAKIHKATLDKLFTTLRSADDFYPAKFSTLISALGKTRR